MTMTTTLYGHWVNNNSDGTDKTFFVPPQAGIGFGHPLIGQHDNGIPKTFCGFEVEEFKIRECWFHKAPDSSAHYSVHLLQRDYDDNGVNPLSGQWAEPPEKLAESLGYLLKVS